MLTHKLLLPEGILILEPSGVLGNLGNTRSDRWPYKLKANSTTITRSMISPPMITPSERRW